MKDALRVSYLYSFFCPFVKIIVGTFDTTYTDYGLDKSPSV